MEVLQGRCRKQQVWKTSRYWPTTLCRGLRGAFVGIIFQPICEANFIIPDSQQRMWGYVMCSI